MLVNFYRSRPDQTADDLIALCASCARKYASKVRLEAVGNPDSECEFCPATNDLEATARRNQDYERFHGR